ncbi:MAG: tetratricopeptide repeat protein [Flavobacteriales bacterium]|nr:tetratricopeptide repeat protein [Flavobacteriales bacterium]
MNYYVYGKEYREEIDKGLAKDSTIAYLWQQRAMPLFKQGKYELGMSYIDKAVKYDPFHWMPYRAFIKCIFAQTYRDAIADFEKCRTVLGNAYVMDHTYNFYIALCKLQLNEFEDAERMLETEVDSQAVLYGDGLVHHLDLFYLGMSKYELGKYEEAVSVFDRALEKYPQFSDVQYYKSYCLLRLGRVEEAEALFALAKENGRAGYTINEDNEVYERYPYQVRWSHIRRPLQSGAPRT